MNDHDLITTVRESFTDVQSATPVEQIQSRSRAIRARRLIPGAAAVVAVAAAAGTAAALIPSGPAGPAPATAPATAQTAAYVVSHVARALDAMPRGTVVFTQSRTVPATSGNNTDTWAAGRGRTRSETFTPSGTPEAASEITFSGPVTRLTRRTTVVDYQNKTWWRAASFYGDGNLPATAWNCRNVGTDDLNWNPRDMAAQLRTELSCGDLKVVGSGTADGVRTVRLSGYFKGSGTLTYWVNAGTYLPFRFMAARGGPAFLMNVQWLPPTAANLAKTRLQVPPGFSRVPPPGN